MTWQLNNKNNPFIGPQLSHHGVKLAIDNPYKSVPIKTYLQKLVVGSARLAAHVCQPMFGLERPRKVDLFSSLTLDNSFPRDERGIMKAGMLSHKYSGILKR